MRCLKPAGARRHAAIVAVVGATLALAGALPVAGQAPSASPDAPGGRSVISLGAVTEVFRDDFTTTDNWGLVDTDEATIEGEDGGLRFRLLTDDQSRWSWHTLDAAAPVLRMGVDAQLSSGSASAGPMCGGTGDAPSFFTGVVNNGGEWVLARVVGNETTVIDRATIDGLQPADGPPVRIELECAVTGDGGDRVALFVNGVNVADITDAESYGPYDRAGLYASVAEGPFDVLFDDVVVLTGDAYDPVIADGPAPTDGPEPSASPDTGGAVISLGAFSEVFSDDFTTTDNWGLVNDDDARISGRDGGLRFRLRTDDQSRWSWYTLDDGAPVMRVGVDAQLDPGPASAGPMCGSTGRSPSFFIGVVNNAGEWVVARVVGNDTTVIDRAPVEGLEPADGPAVRIELECAVTGAGGDRVAMFVNGVNVADITDTESFGPFDKAGLYASVAEGPFEVLFDDVFVLTGDTYDPVIAGGPAPTDAPSPAPSVAPTPAPTATPTLTATPAPTLPPRTPLPVGSLLDAIPEEFRDDCRTVPADEASGQLEAILCAPAGSIPAAEYYRYDSIDSLGAAFDDFVLRAGATPDGAGCREESSMVDYTINGAPAGRLACYTGPGGNLVTFQWSSDALLVLAFGTAGSYADGYTWWQGAGPIP